MNQILKVPEVFTLEEAAKFLRISVPEMRDLLKKGAIPAQQVGRKWRVLKAAIEDWLRKPDYRQGILDCIGAFKDDDTLPHIVEEAYRRRRESRIEE